MEGHRIDTLDLLRGLAAIAVMLPHFFMYTQADGSALAEAISISAVEIFFVLSGFVLGPQLMLVAERGDPATLRTFLVRRWMRTVPSYLVALVAVSIVARPVETADLVRYALYVQNAFAQHNVRDYFPVAWSLSVEEWFYVVFPLLLLAGAGLARTAEMRATATAVLFIAAVTTVRALFGDAEHWGAEVRRVVVFRIDSIAYGFLLYLLVRRFFAGGWTAGPRLAAVLALPVSGLILFTLNGLIAADGPAWAKIANPFAAAAFGAAAVTTCLAFQDRIVSKRAQSLCRWLGAVSYPIYLFHLVALLLIVQSGADWPVALALPGYVLAVVGFASLFHTGFERPILAARPRFSEPAAGAGLHRRTA